MIRALMEKLKWKRKLYEMYKRGLATWGKCRNVVSTCRDATWKAVTHFELNLTRKVKEKRKGLKYVSSKRKTKENVGLLLNELGALVTEGIEKVKLLNSLFGSVFTAKTAP